MISVAAVYSMLVAALLLSANFALATTMMRDRRWITSVGFVVLVLVVSISARCSSGASFLPTRNISLRWKYRHCRLAAVNP